VPQETIAIAVEDKGGGSATDKRKKGVEGEVLDLRAQFLVLKGEMFDLRGNSVCRVNAG